MAGKDGESEGGGLCSIGEYEGKSSISEGTTKDVLVSANIMAHELGHSLNMGHESLGTNNTCINHSFMCSYVQGLPCNNYDDLGVNNRNALKNTVNNASCVNVFNVAPNLCGCLNYVIIGSNTDTYQKLDFGCNEKEYIFDLSTGFTNNCTGSKDYNIEVFYNSDYVEIIEVSDNFNQPIPSSGNTDYNTLLVSNKKTIEDGDADFSTIKVKIKGSGIYGQNRTGTKLIVNYVLNKKTNIKYLNDDHTTFFNTDVLNIFYHFDFPYQMDKRGLQVVKATELKLPDPVYPYDFCFGNTKKDVYIDGNFEINMNQKYCNTNFYFGPNTSLVVKSGQTLNLEKCLLTSCKAPWQGIILEDNAKLIVNGSTIDNTTIGLYSGKRTSKIEIYGQSTFSNFNTAIKLVNSRLDKFENTTLINGQTGLYITNGGFAILKNISTENLRSYGVRSNQTSLIIDACRLKGSGWGISMDGNGNFLSVDNNTTISDWQLGINCLRSSLYLRNSTLNNNMVGCNQSNSPGLIHDIYRSNFNNGTIGFQSINSDLADNSNILDCNFDNQNTAVSITGKPDPHTSWYINSNFTNVKNRGVKLTNADGNFVAGCDFSGQGIANSSMIRVEGGTVNNIYNNDINAGPSASDATQANGISINNAFTSVFCNQVFGGSYGINYWGNCPSYFANNQMGDNHTGFHLGLYPADGTAVINEQRHRFNIWNNGTMSISAKHLGTNDGFVKLSQFKVKEGLSSQYLPDPRVAVAPDWFKLEQVQVVEGDCWESDPDNPNPSARQNTQTNHSKYVNFKNYSHGEQPNLLAYQSSGDEASINIESAPSIKDFTSLSPEVFTKLANRSIDFGRYNQEIYDNTAIQIYRKYFYMGEGSTIYPNMHAYIQGIETTAGVLVKASNLITGTNRYAELLSTSKELKALINTTSNLDGITSNVEKLKTIDSSFVQKYADARLLHEMDIASACASLVTIQDVSGPFANEKKLLLIKADMMRFDTIAESQIIELQSMAQQCPLAGGNAVYEARSILEAKFGYAYYDDHLLCQNVIPRISASKQNAISVKPNPGTDKVIISGIDIRSIDFYTQEGIKVLCREVDSVSDVEVDITELSPALYVIRVTYGRDSKQESIKFIKIK